MGDIGLKKMKYKVGDKVVLMTSISQSDGAREDINKLPDKVATIRTVENGCPSFYRLEEMRWAWPEDWIAGIAPEEVFDPIEDRWEILDL